MKLARPGLVGALALASALAVAGFVACSSSVAVAPGTDAAPANGASSGAAPAVTAGSGLPCDIDQILAANCRKCHQSPTRYGAPMPLLSYEDLLAPSLTDPSQSVFQLSRARMREEGSRMPPPPNGAVSDADLARWDSWVAANTPRGPETCNSQVVPEPETTTECEPDLQLRPLSKYTMPQDQSDQYVCYGVDITPEQARHVFAMSPSVDNTSILHHVLLFESPNAYSPTPTPCSSGGSVSWRIVYGWAPGGTSIVLPPEAGMPLSGTTHYVVQLHYNNVQGLAGQQDGSGFDLCSTTELRPNDADVIAFGTNDIELPPGSHRAYECEFTLPRALDTNLRFIAAMPHMHQLGTAISTTVQPAGTDLRHDLGTVADWNFQTQYWQPLGVDVKSGDTVRTRCEWHNRGSTRVEFGEDTADEMCYSFSMYYPRIEHVPWALPAEASQCTIVDLEP